MAANVYEVMMILNANAYARNPGGTADSIRDLISGAGGKVLASRLWNEQKLAYPVKGHRKGVYWLAYFEMEGAAMTKFNRACQLQESILRHLAIRVDPRLSDTLVAVARGEKTLPAPDLVTAGAAGSAGEVSEE